MNFHLSAQPFTRDQKIILCSIAVIVLLAWTVMFNDARGMEHASPHMTMCSMPRVSFWSAADFFPLFVMWSVMMVAMMLPSVTATALLFSKINRTRREQNNPFVSTWIFLSGYLLVWTGFSFLVSLLQLYLQTKSLLSCEMILTHSSVAGIVLLCAGIFQFTPLKTACLSHCRSPFQFLMTDWREGKWGALLMGLRHGIFCAGCCWALMLLLFVMGVMNFLWIAVLSVFVLLEKMSPKTLRVNCVWGILFIGWGTLIICRVIH